MVLFLLLFLKKWYIILLQQGGKCMKRDHYYFDMPQETYDFIIKKGLLKESKKERTILDLCLEGKSIKEIMVRTGYSQRTINYRKKDIYSKIAKYFF
jgi:DNA-binding NarL/FixJ family response regulator